MREEFARRFFARFGKGLFNLFQRKKYVARFYLLRDFF